MLQFVAMASPTETTGKVLLFIVLFFDVFK